MHNVNWEVFTREEHDVLNKLIEMGERDNLAQGVLDMTPEKEVELQKIADHMRPTVLEFESAVQKEFQQSRLEQGKSPFPETPEEEKELQKKLDAEMAAYQQEIKMQSAIRQESLEGSMVKEETGGNEEVKEIKKGKKDNV